MRARVVFFLCRPDPSKLAGFAQSMVLSKLLEKSKTFQTCNFLKFFEFPKTLNPNPKPFMVRSSPSWVPALSLVCFASSCLAGVPQLGLEVFITGSTLLKNPNYEVESHDPLSLPCPPRSA